MSLIDDLMGAVGGDLLGKVSERTGLSKAQAGDAVKMVTPILLAGLRKKQEQEGDDAVGAVIESVAGAADPETDVDACLLRGLSEEGPNDVDLGGLLGGAGAKATELLASQFSMSKGDAAKLIPMLAPVVFGILKKEGAKGGGGMEGGVKAILDRDGDGGVLDDVSRILFGERGEGVVRAAQALGVGGKGGKGGKASGSGRGGGGLIDLLGKVLGGGGGRGKK